MSRSYGQIRDAIRKHGPGGFLAVGGSLPFLALARRLDSSLYRQSWYSARVKNEVLKAFQENIDISPAFKEFESQGILYRDYLLEQIAKSLQASSKFSFEKKLNVFLHKYVYPEKSLLVRVSEIASFARANLLINQRPPGVLSVGCRDELELVALRRILDTSEVLGLDIFSLNASIRSGDMHSLPFPANRFDVVVSCHSLEHSYDPYRALTEFIRVLREGGILAIEVPAFDRFADGPLPITGAADKWDFCNPASLLKTIRAVTPREVTSLHVTDPSDKRMVLQLVARIG